MKCYAFRIKDSTNENDYACMLFTSSSVDGFINTEFLPAMELIELDFEDDFTAEEALSIMQQRVRGEVM